MMKYLKDTKFWISVIGVTGLGLLSGIFTLNAKEYYQILSLPAFAPPGWIFGPVWTILYIMMGITFYIILNHQNTKQRNNMLTIFLIQFILNVLWSFLFFFIKSNILATIEITMLWAVLLIQQYYYFKYKKIAMWLMTPYFLWVSFATILTYAVLILN